MLQDIIKKLGSMIRDKRENLGWSQDRLVEELHKEVSKATISRIERGLLKSHEITSLTPLCEWVGVTLFDLSDERKTRYYEVASASPPSPAGDDTPVELWDIYHKLITRPEETFLVRVIGDSMEDAKIFEKDILVVQKIRDLESIQNGAIIVCFVKEGCCVKKYHKTGSRTELHSANEARQYEPIEVTSDDQFIVWGRVIYSMRQFT